MKTWGYEMLELRAEALRRSDPELTEDEAIVRAAEDNPWLVEKHQEEIRKAIG